MKKPDRFERAVLTLTAVFLAAAALRFFLGGGVSRGWQVSTQYADRSAPAVSTGEGSWPDSLLDGEVLDLNTASRADLERLPNVGAVRAQAIVDWRQANGPFQSVDQLAEVPGIGTGTVEGLRPYVTVR